MANSKAPDRIFIVPGTPKDVYYTTPVDGLPNVEYVRAPEWVSVGLPEETGWYPIVGYIEKGLHKAFICYFNGEEFETLLDVASWYNMPVPLPLPLPPEVSND